MSRRVMTKLVAALALSAAFVWAACGQSRQAEEAVETGSASSRRTPRRAGGDGEADVKESVDLASLLKEIPEYAGRGRNLFAFGSLPAVSPPPVTPPLTPPTTPPPSPSPLARTRAVPTDLKFAGYVETKTPAGETKKYAVLLDGSEILTGAEGDLVANRYRIVQIGLESVTVGVQGSETTQRIPLRSN